MTEPWDYSELNADQREIWDVADKVLSAGHEDPVAGTALGWMGIGTDPQFGAMGGTFADLAPLLECVGYHAAATCATWTAGIAVPLLAASEHPDAALIEQLADGRHRVAIAAAPLPVPTDTGGEIVCDSLGGVDAAYLLVPLIRDQSVMLGLLPADRRVAEDLRSIDISRPWSRHHIDPSAIDAKNLVRAPDLAAAWRCARNRVFALDSVGTARAALQKTVSYALQREQFGRPIGGFQAYKHRVVDALLRLKLAQSVAYRAAADPSDGRLAAAAAVEASAMASFVCGEAVQLHGAIGLTWEAGIGTLLKRARANEIVVDDRANAMTLTTSPS